ncbi:MAG: methyltransferase [Paludibacteraceae bacterium]|nr:methyltransferase [Paludibacteraceae bacterium]
MSNTYFRFKQFTVNQDRCAMKVGTDGVVLGVTVNFEGHERLVDVGTGTGLVSLIVKQRYPSAQITAVEINEEAARQASENFKESPWEIDCINDSWQHFASVMASESQKFDGIFCNPPYFTNSLKAPSEDRSVARHNNMLPFSHLLKGVAEVLKENGRFFVILPSDDKSSFCSLAFDYGLHLRSVVYVHPVIGGLHKRVVMEFSKEGADIADEEHLYIETRERKVYTPQFRELTKDFYL